MRSIIGFSQIILTDAHDKLSNNERSDLNRVISAGKHMAHLIDDILELSRITREGLDSCETNLSELAAAHVLLLESHEPKRTVNFHVEPGLHAIGDPKLLDIMLKNLLDNAWQFTAKRDDAEISLRSQQMDNEIVYSLCDNGVGFDMTYPEISRLS